MATQIPTTEHGKTLPKHILKKHHAPCIPVDTPPSIRGIFHTLKDAHTSTYRDPDAPLASTLSDGDTLRIDLSNWYTLTIDGHDARDLDDAISLASTDPGDILLGVHIADVAHFVEDGSPIDQEARKRGCSVYLPGEVIPMLPEYLANDLCSLHP